MSQLDVSLHSIVLAAPKLNLQFASFSQVAVELAPAFSSHFEEPSQTIVLPSPPLPLHSALGAQLIEMAPVLVASHFVPVWQLTAQLAAPHCVWQSLVHAQLPASQLQLVPVHVAALAPAEASVLPPSPAAVGALSLPHATGTNNPTTTKPREANRTIIEKEYSCAAGASVSNAAAPPVCGTFAPATGRTPRRSSSGSTRPAAHALDRLSPRVRTVTRPSAPRGAHR
jgi:hypothetical protein